MFSCSRRSQELASQVGIKTPNSALALRSVHLIDCAPALVTVSIITPLYSLVLPALTSERKTSSGPLLNCPSRAKIGAYLLPYLEHATRCLKEHGSSDDNLLEDLSPLGWEHINLTGDYVWPRTRMPLNTSNSFCLFRKPSVKIEDVDSLLVGPRPFSETIRLLV